jgi:hypothetical protein
MTLVEQAIFTSLETDREAGYQVVASSPGVCEADARELAVWGPSRDSLLDMGPDAESFSFHPLPSGAHCISRSTPAGWEHGGGRRVHTHCLIVPPAVLARFGNNPFALVRVVSEQCLWLGPDGFSRRLESESLPGGAAAVDQMLLNQLAADPGAKDVAALVQAARDAVCLALAGTPSPLPLIAGLFSCLPPECRPEFSFCTGLKFSPRRPFRIVALSGDPAERLWVANYPNVTVLELGRDAARGSMPVDGWSRLIERTLVTDHIPFLAAQISKRRFDLTLDDLPALGLQLLESLDSSECCNDGRVTEATTWHPTMASGRAHAAHQQFTKSIKTAMATPSVEVPSAQVGHQTPEVLEKLEHLDDLVYEAISGQTNSLEQLRRAWPTILGELGEDLLAESREQYLRYALSIWEESANGDAIRNPARAIQALDVLCLLFGDAT